MTKKKKRIIIITAISLCAALVLSAALYALDYRSKYYYPLSEAKERLTPYMDKICEILENYGIKTEGLVEEKSEEDYYSLSLKRENPNDGRNFDGNSIWIVLERDKNGENFKASFDEPAAENYYEIHDSIKRGYISEILILLAGKKYSDKFIEYMYDNVREKVSKKGLMQLDSFYQEYWEQYNFFR